MLDSVIHDKFNAQNIEQQTKLTVLLHFTVFLSLSQVTQISCEMVSLQCFDAVGWAAGRASGL